MPFAKHTRVPTLAVAAVHRAPQPRVWSQHACICLAGPERPEEGAASGAPQVGAAAGPPHQEGLGSPLQSGRAAGPRRALAHTRRAGCSAGRASVEIHPFCAITNQSHSKSQLCATPVLGSHAFPPPLRSGLHTLVLSPRGPTARAPSQSKGKHPAELARPVHPTVAGDPSPCVALWPSGGGVEHRDTHSEKSPLRVCLSLGAWACVSAQLVPLFFSSWMWFVAYAREKWQWPRYCFLPGDLALGTPLGHTHCFSVTLRPSLRVWRRARLSAHSGSIFPESFLGPPD